MGPWEQRSPSQVEGARGTVTLLHGDSAHFQRSLVCLSTWAASALELTHSYILEKTSQNSGIVGAPWVEEDSRGRQRRPHHCPRTVKLSLATCVHPLDLLPKGSLPWESSLTHPLCSKGPSASLHPWQVVHPPSLSPVCSARNSFHAGELGWGVPRKEPTEVQKTALAVNLPYILQLPG